MAKDNPSGIAEPGGVTTDLAVSMRFVRAEIASTLAVRRRPSLSPPMPLKLRRSFPD